MRILLLALCFFFSISVFGLAEAAPVNINTASAEELKHSLNGIGHKRAERIVEYRERHGAFETPEDIMTVPYIGPRLFEANRNDILVN